MSQGGEMAETEIYEITYDNGVKRYRKLDNEGVKQFEAAAKSKTSVVESIKKGKPEPRNKARAAASNK